MVENNMTEIHERLQPVAEVGENGEEDSISGEETLIPLGSSSMTRPLFIQQHNPQNSDNSEQVSSSSSDILSSNVPPTSFLNEDEDNFHLKRIGSSFPGEGMIHTQHSGHLQTSLHNSSYQTDQPLCNNTTQIDDIQRTNARSTDQQHNAVKYLEKDFGNEKLADDILEYDEDNVIVIDLDDIRNNPTKETEIVKPTPGMEQPKRRVEITRQVYYDDSDLFSPPPSTLDENEEPGDTGMPVDNSHYHSAKNCHCEAEQSPVECLLKDCDPNTDVSPRTVVRKDSSTESSSATASVNSQTNEITCQSINQVPLPPPFQSVLDEDGTNQEEPFNDNENDFSQIDIVQPPSPFSERSCSSSATTGASSIKQSHCHDATHLKSRDMKSGTATKVLNEGLEQSIMHPHKALLIESDQPVFYETSKFERQKLVAFDNHSQLTLSSISSDTVCQQDLPVVPSSISDSNKKITLNQSTSEHPTTLPPVKVHGRTSLTSASFNNSHRDVGYEDSVVNSQKNSMQKNSQYYQPENQQFSTIQPLEIGQSKECRTHNGNNLPIENHREKRDRPNQLFPSVPTSSSVIINNNSCGVSPSASAKVLETHNKNITALNKTDAIQEYGADPMVDGDMDRGHRSKRKEPRHRMRKKLPSTKHIPFRDVSTPTAQSDDATAIKQELEREKRSASCRRSKDSKRHDSESRTNTYNSHNDILNANMSYSNYNTLQRNFGGRSSGSGADGADIMRKTYYRGGIYGRRAKSNDMLDQMDVQMTKSCLGALDGGMSGSVRGELASLSQSYSGGVEKMTKIEKHLFLGSLEAATDAILLEAHNISHIVTVDSISLPQKMTSLLPRIALLYLQVTDLPDEDLLSHFNASNEFINDCIERQGGACLIHCFRGRSRSATVVAAYLMHKHGYSAQKAIAKIRSKRPSINPHESFLAQLKMYESMDYSIDTTNIQLKMFRLHCASERMRKAKILFRDSLDLVLDEDPANAGNMGRILSGITGEANISKSGQRSSANHPVVYKCKRCRRTLGTAFNMLPHCTKESPNWRDAKWSLPCEEVLEGASDTGLALCSASVFINPTRWMAGEIKAKLAGRLYCPQCQARVGNYSWVMGRECNSLSGGCGAAVVPAFQLDVTEIIFRTRNKYMQSTGREPVTV